MPMAQLGDAAIFHECVGSGPPCLVMHGGLGVDHAYLRPWFDPLGDTLRLIYYDHRGNGRSDAVGRDTLTHARLASDADALCAHLGMERVAVIGHSYGGFIALEFALRYPQRVSHLILVDTGAVMDTPEQIGERARRKGASEDMLQLLANADVPDESSFRRRLASLLPLYFHSPHGANAAELFDGCLFRVAGRTSARERGAYDSRPRLREIAVPALVLAGRDDFICSPEHSHALADGIAGAELAIFERSGHFPFVEQSGEFLCTVRRWLLRNGRQ